MTSPDDRLARAFAAIDAANADDPFTIVARGEERPKELAHATLASEWLARLRPDADEALQLAVRAHHVRRWEIPRSDFPEGRAGYHRWRKALQAHHAAVSARILTSGGFPPETVARVGALIRKQGLGRDPDAQALEDALCLVFLETQFHALAVRLEQEKLVDVTRKTLRKMSPEAIALAEGLPLDPADQSLLRRATEAVGVA